MLIHLTDQVTSVSTLNEQQISKKENVKYLGIHLNSKIT